ALGSCDIFHCLNGETGEVIWKRPLHEQFGMLSTYGGRTNFPVVHEDLVIISGIIINWGDKAKPNHRLLGMDKLTGEVVWFNGTRDLPYDTTYSAPSIVTIEGQRQLILGTGDGQVWGFQPRTGKPVWNYAISRRGVYATPLVVGNRVYAIHGEENTEGSSMGAVVALEVTGAGDETQVKELWRHEEIVMNYSEPVVIDDRIYLVDDRCKMWIFNTADGEPIVERKKIIGRGQRSALIYADNKIFVLTEGGRWAICQPTDDGFEVIGDGRLRGASFGGSPIVADGRLYFPSTTALYCVGTGQAKQTPVSLAGSLGNEQPVKQDTKISQVLVVPSEELVKPGESIDYSVRVFNQLGQLLDTPSDVEFTVRGPAGVSESQVTASTDAAHDAAYVTATVGGVEGSARLRIVPPLPWKFTFDDLDDPPVSWVGARYRHVIRTIDGSPALTKVTTIPKGARSRAWMGPSDLAEYTISADIKGARMNDQLPDIGLTNMGYVLDLQGESQKLQIRTWSAQLRMASTIDFPWKEDVWYRMKFRVDLESEPPAQTAVLRGKVWPKGQPEPKEWTVTARDESPNTNASPGLYGSAKVAELYLDNIEVVAND
ncbi:MAG: PQQ-binding-like beta-propeller repeat protein, partial [Planctomycetota bacterium]